ncbi:sulfatase-like hydrolase/transferase [Bacillus lacus]|uniref:Sulfatase-like hydrolase/transferase n=1 Tax=Metabacillus lacus TaxID=1983721 RepID=A0A7X2IZN1_9BACI|nr:LTA synthase family protein [Metabacillus lacus]MRX72626.1 sulfatase-like hydrolase/transferase [Metabacillus lacus]
MRKKSVSTFAFTMIATVLMWIKTYVVYKTSFNIKIENFTQEIILFINPLSFLLLVFGIGLFLKEKNRNRYIIGASMAITFILLANMIFYRFFTDFLTIPVLFQTSNMGDLGSSITELFQPVDLLMLVDIIILMWLSRKPYFRKQASEARTTAKVRTAYYLLVAAVFFFNLGLAETERPQLLTRSFDREMLVKNISVYNFHIYDGIIQSKTTAQRALADSNSLTDIENYVNANRKEPAGDLFGIAKNRNVIVVTLESLQSFVMNEELNGQEITPFLNQLARESYNFENFYHQTGQGKTADSEFLVDNSLYPLSRGAVFFTNANNEFMATPEVLKEEGYYSAVFHANNKSFWNRDIMYQAFAYDRFFDIRDYDVNPENSVGWGLKDIEFFEQTVEHLKNVPQPFYTRMITLTNHFPFELGEEDKMIEEFDSNSRTLNRYFPTVRYLDESIKVLFEKLKEEGLYDNSMILLYGDHYGISENHNGAMSQFLGKEITPFESTQLQRVPFMIHIPGVTDNNPRNIEEVAGQIDMKPTLMHLLGIDTREHLQFGHDLFAEKRLPFAVLRDGSFITDELIYTGGACFVKESGEPAEEGSCEPYIEKAKQELDYSDKIVNGDLLRFYHEQLDGLDQAEEIQTGKK